MSVGGSTGPVRIVQAAGGVVLRGKEEKCQVLMIYRHGLWDLPKGKVEKGESRKVCAGREIAEETGVVPAGGWGEGVFIGVTEHHYQLNGEHLEKWTSWWQFRFDEGGRSDQSSVHCANPQKDPDKILRPQLEEGITRVAWVPLNKAVEIAGFDNLRWVLKHVRLG